MASVESYQSLATAKAILSAVGSIAATVVVVRGVTHDLLPKELRDYLFSGLKNFFTRFSNQLTLVIDEFDGLSSNEIYDAAVVYIGQKISPNTSRLKICKPEKEKHVQITMERGDEVLDVYKGEKFKWVWKCIKTDGQSFYNPRNRTSSWRTEKKTFELTFHNRNRDLVVNSYLPYIANEAQKKKQEKRTVKIFTVDKENLYDRSDLWMPMTLDHPATFETLAMDLDQKDMILSDLDRFVKRREYYRKVGKAWKRGYLLYGPPGTGKSSLIAAMANYLNFDIYDLELTELRRNSDLRKLLVMTANKSILVVEDIDCTIDLKEKLGSRICSDPEAYHEDKNKVTLSGLLNFVDGLWSSCGDERIIIFTTNHVEKLDPALLRPGRMDVHINMSYCTPCGFKLLASNYLGIQDHGLFEEVANLIRDAKVTPAEVAEQLLKNDEADASLKGLIQFMHEKMEEDKVSEAEKMKAELTGKLKAEFDEESDAEASEEKEEYI